MSPEPRKNIPGNHDGFGWDGVQYSCFCGYPVSAPISPVSTNHPTAPAMIHKMKQAWHEHKARATYANN